MVFCIYHVDSNDLFSVLAVSVLSIVIRLTPAFVVAVSSVISVVLLKKRNVNVPQKELQQSRNRATVTIILFSLLYELCNLPHAVSIIFIMYNWSFKNRDINSDLFPFDRKYYLFNAMYYLVPGNSAANPVLYFWRMPSLRKNIISRFGTILKINKRPSTKRDVHVMNENIVVKQPTPPSSSEEAGVMEQKLLKRDDTQPPRI